MEQQYKNPIKAEEIILDMPQDVSQDPNADALQKLNDLFPAGYQSNITKDSEENFSAEITVGDNKYIGLCSKDGTPIGNWTLKRGEDSAISIKFQNNSFFFIIIRQKEEIVIFETEAGGKFIDDSSQLVLGSGKLIGDLYQNNKYNGEFLDNKFNGQGTFTFANGGKYVGNWQNGEKNGKGTHAYADGGKYVGNWQNGKKNGQGTCTYADGAKYEGEWENDKKNGQGTCTYASGTIYEGDWQDGKQHGQGKYAYANGAIYEGEFKDNKFNGQGKYAYTNGEEYVGNWQNGEKNGKGTYKYPNNSKFEGEFKDGERNGKGIYTGADGKKCEEEWENGKLKDKKKEENKQKKKRRNQKLKELKKLKEFKIGVSDNTTIIDKSEEGDEVHSLDDEDFSLINRDLTEKVEYPDTTLETPLKKYQKPEEEQKVEEEQKIKGGGLSRNSATAKLNNDRHKQDRSLEKLKSAEGERLSRNKSSIRLGSIDIKEEEQKIKGGGLSKSSTTADLNVYRLGRVSSHAELKGAKGERLSRNAQSLIKRGNASILHCRTKQGRSCSRTDFVVGTSLTIESTHAPVKKSLKQARHSITAQKLEPNQMQKNSSLSNKQQKQLGVQPNTPRTSIVNNEHGQQPDSSDVKINQSLTLQPKKHRCQK